MSTAHIVKLVCDDWLDHMAPSFIPNACIAASATAVEVLAYFGVKAEAVACDAVFFNETAWALHEQNVPIEDWPEEAWSVGTDHRAAAEDGRYAGHLVLVIDDGYVVDLTPRQFDRPAKKILLTPIVVFEIVNPAAPAVIVNGDVHGIYMLRPEAKRWKHTPDYRHRSKRAAEMIRRIRSEFDVTDVTSD